MIKHTAGMSHMSPTEARNKSACSLRKFKLHTFNDYRLKISCNMNKKKLASGGLFVQTPPIRPQYRGLTSASLWSPLKWFMEGSRQEVFDTFV